jgi:DNA-binding response OmpR family regulator
MTYKLFIVEDDPVIAGALADGASSWGYVTRTAADYRDVLREFADFSPHIVLLDISLPLYNGYHWCQKIRAVSKVPVIFISSASDNMNILMAINMGGDDFIAKPFDLDVAMAKINAMVRRTYELTAGLPILEAGGVVLNVADSSLSVGGVKTELTKNEFRILEVLMENKGRVISRDTLMLRLWESDSYIDDNTLTVNVARLRKKLSDAGAGELIKTKKGLGYMIENDH